MADHRQLHSTDALLIQGGFAVVATALIPYLEAAIWQISGAQEVNPKVRGGFQKTLYSTVPRRAPLRFPLPTADQEQRPHGRHLPGPFGQREELVERGRRNCARARPAWRTPRGSIVVSTAVCTCRPFAGSRSRGCGVYS